MWRGLCGVALRCVSYRDARRCSSSECSASSTSLLIDWKCPVAPRAAKSSVSTGKGPKGVSYAAQPVAERERNACEVQACHMISICCEARVACETADQWTQLAIGLAACLLKCTAGSSRQQQQQQQQQQSGLLAHCNTSGRRRGETGLG